MEHFSNHYLSLIYQNNLLHNLILLNFYPQKDMGQESYLSVYNLDLNKPPKPDDSADALAIALTKLNEDGFN